MAKSNKVFALHPGEILKTEFMEPMGISAHELAKKPRSMTVDAEVTSLR
jgi:plasmid maintenance system antidote protein VapI